MRGKKSGKQNCSLMALWLLCLGLKEGRGTKNCKAKARANQEDLLMQKEKNALKKSHML